MMRALRWTATVPAFCAGIALGVLLALALLQLLDRLCPPELMVSGLCTAWWFSPAQTAVLAVSAAVAAVASLLAVALVCPGRRIRAVTVAWIVGSVYALGAWLEVGIDFTWPALAAIGAGALVVARLRRRRMG